MFGYFLQLQHTWKTHVVWTGVRSTLEVLIKYFLKCNSQACNIPQPYTMSTCLPTEVSLCREPHCYQAVCTTPNQHHPASPDPGLNPDHHWDPALYSRERRLQTGAALTFFIFHLFQWFCDPGTQVPGCQQNLVLYLRR